MANRILRDWTCSEKVDQLSEKAEIFFTRLIMKADDYGRFYGSSKLIKGHLFPLRDYSFNEIESMRDECVKHELVKIYTVDGRDYIEIIDFGQRLRIMKSKFPEQQRVTENDRQPLTDDRGMLTDDRLKRNETKRNETEIEIEIETEVEKKPEIDPRIEIEIFTPKEIVDFVNLNFDKSFTEKQLSRFDRDLINDLIRVNGYEKRQIITAWENMKKDEFYRSKKFNMVNFRHLSKTDVIERFVFWKDENSTDQPTANGVFSRKNLNL